MKYSLSYNEFISSLQEKANIDYERQELLFRIKKTYRVLVMLGGLGGAIISLLALLIYMRTRDYQNTYGEVSDDEFTSPFDDLNNNTSSAYNKTNLKSYNADRKMSGSSSKVKIPNKKLNPVFLAIERMKLNPEDTILIKKMSSDSKFKTLVDNIINSNTKDVAQRNASILLTYIEKKFTPDEKKQLTELIIELKPPAEGIKTTDVEFLRVMDELSKNGDKKIASLIAKIRKDPDYNFRLENLLAVYNNTNKSELTKTITRIAGNNHELIAPIISALH